MKVLVTGGLGFIGSHVVPYLLAEGHEVIVVDNFSNGSTANLGPDAANTRLTILEDDITHQGDWSSEYGQLDWVIHLAAPTSITESIENPRLYMDSIMMGTFNVLELSRRCAVKKFVYINSAACYGKADIYPTPENAEKRPQYPYALMKWLGEELALHWSEVYSLPVISLRLFNLYGERASALFGLFLKLRSEDRPLTVTGDGSQTRDMTHIDDIVNAIYTALNSNVAGQVFNISSGQTISVRKISEFFGGRVDYVKRRSGEMDITHGDISRARNLLGWKPKKTPDKGIPDTLKKILKNGDS